MFGLTRRNNHYPETTYNPFHQMDEMERRFFGPAFDDFFRPQGLMEFKTDVTDEGDHFLLEADLPGFDKNDIRLELDGDTLTVRAERHSNVEKKEKDKVVYVERSYGSYCRSYDVSGIDTEAIQAKYNNGVLQLTLPKLASQVPAARTIDIQ